MHKIRKYILMFKDYRLNDPVYHCEIYIAEGCAHVDGFLCDMKTCSSRKDFKVN